MSRRRPPEHRKAGGSRPCGGGDDGQKIFWLFLGALMLWLVVQRRSRLARAFVVVTSLLGGIVYAIALLLYPVGPSHAAVLSALFFGQAVPLMTRPIRDHVLANDRTERALRESAGVLGPIR